MPIRRPSSPRNIWWTAGRGAVGSPATVAALVREQFEMAGGFGTLLMLGSDYADEGERRKWFRSMELLATEVMPQLSDLPVQPS